MAAIDDDLGEIIQANVRRFRKELGWSQQRLADEAGVSVDGVRKWEGRRGVPDRESVTKMAAALGRRMDDFNMREPPAPEARRVSPFVLKVAEDAPADLRRQAEAYIERLNLDVAQRGVQYPAGVRPSTEKTHPLTTVRREGVSRKTGRQGRQAQSGDLPSERKRPRR